MNQILVRCKDSIKYVVAKILAAGFACPFLPSSLTKQSPAPKLFCAFEHHLLSRIICLPLPTSKRVDIHEVNCYSNCPTLHRMMTTTFNSQHVFHNYPQHELVVSAHSENITFGHNWVLPADRHGPTTRCYHTDAPRHPFDRISRWLVFCTCTASKFLIGEEVYGSR